MSAKLFDEILATGIRAGQLPGRTQDARKWYRAKAGEISKRKAEGTRLVRTAENTRLKAKSRFRIGSMYMFVYDPKHKETLPYYDRFPLVIPIGPAQGGFLGINFHYLPPVLRAKLMDALYDTVTNDRLDESTRLRINYQKLKAATKFKEFKPCIKHYLTPHIRTRLVYVNPAEWDIALFLPSANFYGASKTKVYAESRIAIRNRGK
jgi:hypothetical protein